jgi:hypothetical protein
MWQKHNKNAAKYPAKHQAKNSVTIPPKYPAGNVAKIPAKIRVKTWR